MLECIKIPLKIGYGLIQFTKNNIKNIQRNLIFFSARILQNINNSVTYLLVSNLIRVCKETISYSSTHMHSDYKIGIGIIHQIIQINNVIFSLHRLLDILENLAHESSFQIIFHTPNSRRIKTIDNQGAHVSNRFYNLSQCIICRI